jgi:hypothetical protein
VFPRFTGKLAPHPGSYLSKVQVPRAWPWSARLARDDRRTGEHREGRKPLARSHTLSENSQMASGAVRATASREGLPGSPSTSNSTPMPARRANRSSPSAAAAAWIATSSSPEESRSRARRRTAGREGRFGHARRPVHWQRRQDPRCVGGFGETFRSPTIDIKLTTPTRMRIDSTVREATYPRATLSLTRFTIGKMTTAVAMPEIANRISSRAPTATPMSPPYRRRSWRGSRSGCRRRRPGSRRRMCQGTRHP